MRKVAVERVTAGFGDDVEHAAGGKTLVSTKSAGLDLDFLYKLERQVSAAAAKCRVGGVDTVENVCVLRTGRTGNRWVAVAA